MTITGLENDYYLAGNDIWVSVEDEANEILRMVVENLHTGKSLVFRMSPAPSGKFIFNASAPVRALMDEPDHDARKNLQAFNFGFDNHDTGQGVQKYFVRGGRDKNGRDEWHLSPSAELIEGRWLVWEGIDWPGYAKRIQNDTIVDFVPSNPYKMPRKNCEYKIIKWLNGLGGFQYYAFDSWEVKTKTKPGKRIPNLTRRLRQDNFRNSEIEEERTLTLFCRTPVEVQEVVESLVKSVDVYLFHPEGNDDDSRWERLVLTNNETLHNSFEQVFLNKLEFGLSKYVTRRI